ncbi:hypothetical protein AB0O34_13430 [Sphaerisporangium sp. NPDC088356]|uniref:hypothetical protein n=1 Tax=Sphaerisporangium sp. NPDC088356 TaxID=3154871 RepID=UPI0034246F22
MSVLKPRPRSGIRAHRPLLAAVAASVVVGAVALAGLLVDDRMLTGEPIWMKPFKFAVSVALYAVTLAWMLSHLRRERPDLAVASAIRLGMVVSLAGMALGLSMTTSTPALDSLRTGVVDGIAGAHSVGVPDGGPGLPVVGWSTSGGDLRVAHFLGIHALQAMPLVAVALGVLALRTAWLRPERVRVRLIRLAAGTYAGVVAVAAWQALRGQPLTSPDAATLVTFVTLLEISAGAAAVVLWMGRRDTAGAPTSAPEETICPSTPPSVTASSSAGER